MALTHSPLLVTDKLEVCIDAVNVKSYSGSGTSVIDISRHGRDATLVNGKDEYNFFNKEKSIDEVSIDELKKIHKKILINQFEKYLKIKLKFNFITKFMMIFFNNDFLRGVVYKLSKKI